jgi:hypothetical protein
MRQRFSLIFVPILFLALVTLPASSSGQAPGKAKIKIEKEKQLVLDLLSKPETVERFGKISDAIWEYAELGLQEFRSSKLLADTLEQAGFKVEPECRLVSSRPTAPGSRSSVFWANSTPCR